jgi:ribosomal protein L29
MQALRSAVAGPQLAGRASTQRRAVVAAARPTAAADFRGLSDAELVAQVKSLKAEYAKLQYMKRTRGKVQNPETLQVRSTSF